MDWRVRFSVPCCSPRNPGDFAYFNKHVTDILDFAHSERSSYNFLGRLRPIADFPGFSVIHAWKFPSLRRLPEPTFGLEFVDAKDDCACPRNPSEPGLQVDRGTIAKASIDFDTNFEAEYQQRFNKNILGHGYVLGGPGSKNSVVGANLRYDASFWNTSLKYNSDGRVIGVSGALSLDQATAVGAEAFYAFEKEGDSWAVGVRRKFLDGGPLSPIPPAILSASLNAYGNVTSSFSCPIRRALTLATQIVYELSSYESKVRLGADYMLPVRMPTRLRGMVDLEGRAAVDLALLTSPDLGFHVGVTRGTDKRATGWGFTFGFGFGAD